MSRTPSPEAVPATTDRTSDGRFATGNRGGPGNPFARQTAALRAYLINQVTERDLQDILDVLLLNAKAGHLPTIKFLFAYILGKPKPVVEPDLLDLQEMQMLQQAAQRPSAGNAVRSIAARFPGATARCAQADNATAAVHGAGPGGCRATAAVTKRRLRCAARRGDGRCAVNKRLFRRCRRGRESATAVTKRENAAAASLGRFRVAG